MSHFPGLKIDTNNFRFATHPDTYINFTAHSCILYHTYICLGCIPRWTLGSPFSKQTNLEQRVCNQKRKQTVCQSEIQITTALAAHMAFFSEVCFVGCSSYCQWILTWQICSNQQVRLHRREVIKNNWCWRCILQTSCNFMYISTTDSDKVLKYCRNES